MDDTARNDFEFDFVISYAGEDEDYATRLRQALVDGGARVFFAPEFQAELWGKNLFEYLADLYNKKGRYCIILVSDNYVKKKWTRHEWRSAQERALAGIDATYVLPIRLDGAELPGLLETTAYLDARQTPLEQIARLALEKLNLPLDARPLPGPIQPRKTRTRLTPRLLIFVAIGLTAVSILLFVLLSPTPTQPDLEQFLPNSQLPNTQNIVLRDISAANGYVWFATDTGLYQWHAADGRFGTIPSVPYALTSVEATQGSAVWFGIARAEGLLPTAASSDRIGLYAAGASTPALEASPVTSEGQELTNVLSILVDPDQADAVWLGDIFQEVFIYNKNSHILERLPHTPFYLDQEARFGEAGNQNHRSDVWARRHALGAQLGQGLSLPGRGGCMDRVVPGDLRGSHPSPRNLCDHGRRCRATLGGAFARHQHPGSGGRPG